MSELGQKIIKGVRLYASLAPDHVYQKSYTGGCEYIRDGAPSCLVGHALWFAGLIDAEFKGDDLDMSAIDAMAIHYGWRLDPSELSWLRNVQHNQDSNAPWGEAVVTADCNIAL